jgi:hypothetical protein
MCCAFAEVVGADGAAIALGTTQTERRLLAVTDPLTEKLEDLQDMVGEGPSIQALQSESPAILMGAPGTEEQWPLLIPALDWHNASRGRPALYALPMRPQQTVLGVVLSEAHGLTMEQASARLEEVAESQQVALADAAQRVIERASTSRRN